MEWNLSLALDKNAQISLDLVHMESKQLDEYVSSVFISSEDVRKKYATQIEKFLDQHREFIKKIEADIHRPYAGGIVITELKEDLSVKKIKVLYKKDIVVFEEIIKNKKFILDLENRDYINFINAYKNNKEYSRLFADYYAKNIRFRSLEPKKFSRIINSWQKAIKESPRYYEIIRIVLKEYENRYKNLGLDSLTVVYSKYMKEKDLERKSKELEMQSLDNLNNEENLELELLMYEEDYKSEKPPRRYKTYADEEGYPGDLDDSYNHEEYSNLEEIDDIPSKTKSLHLNIDTNL